MATPAAPLPTPATAEPGRLIRIKSRRPDSRPPGSVPFDVSSIIHIEEKDLQDELAAFKKTRERIEKNNDRLLLELEKSNKEEERWENELVKLEKDSKQILENLENELRTASFDWKRDQKISQSELDQALVKLDDMEGDLEEKSEKEEREQEREIIRLTEELAKLQKGDADNDARVAKLEAELKGSEMEYEEADKEEKRIKREIVYANEELNKVKKEGNVFKQKFEDIKKVEKELSREEESKDEIESEVERIKKAIKRLEKELSQTRTEQKSLSDIQKEIEDWQNRNEKLEKDHERIKNECLAAASTQKTTSPSTTPVVPSRITGGGSTEAAAESRAASREIEDLELAVDLLRKEYAQMISQIESKITDANFEENKLVTRANREETEEINQLKADLKKIRETMQSDEQEKTKDLSQIENERKSIMKELSNSQKELAAKVQECSDTKFLLLDLKSKISKLLQQIAKTEYDLQQAKDTEERIARERKDMKLQTEVVNQQLKETQDELTNTKHELSDLQADYKDFVKQHEAITNDLEAELFAEARRTDEARRERFKLTKDIDYMRVYLKPADGQKKLTEENPEYMERWLEQVREERLAEVKKMKENLAKIRPKDLSLKELQSSFEEKMNLLSPEDKEDLGYELKDLNEIMTELNMPAKERLSLFLTFAEDNVQPGVVREIGRLLKQQTAPGGLHPLKSAMHLVNLSKRDVKLDPKLKLREVILEKLAVERYHRNKKSGRDVEYCRIIILEGGEENEQ